MASSMLISGHLWIFCAVDPYSGLSILVLGVREVWRRASKPPPDKTGILKRSVRYLPKMSRRPPPYQDRSQPGQVLPGRHQGPKVRGCRVRDPQVVIAIDTGRLMCEPLAGIPKVDSRRERGPAAAPDQ